MARNYLYWDEPSLGADLALSLGDSTLQTSATCNPHRMARASDFDQASDIKSGDSVFVVNGIANGATTWAVNSGDAPVMGTDPITFVQVAGQGSFTAGNGIAITGISIAIDTGVTVDKTTAQTLTNKTLTSPTLTTPALGTALGTTNSIGSATTPRLTHCWGWAYSTVGGSGASGLVFQWSQNTSGSNATTRLAGSVIRYHQMTP